MQIVLPLIALIAFLLARRWLRVLIVRRWLADEITNRQAAALFAALTFLPMAGITVVAVAVNPSGWPLFLPVVLVILMGFAMITAGVDYMATYGVKEHMRRTRDRDRASE